MSHTVAILLFSRTAGEEALHKSFSTRGRAVNRRIAGYFIAHAERVARQSGLPVVHVSSAQQRGGTFGERLVSAFRLVFARGYDKVLAIGNDCPCLTAPLLQAAAARLQAQEVVLGPARDGGAYLIGLSAGGFRSGDFGRLAWQTPSCYESLLTYCRAHGLSCAQLPPHRDLDTRRDVSHFLRSHHPAQPVRALVQSIRNLLQNNDLILISIPAALSIPSPETLHSRRGPPPAP